MHNLYARSAGQHRGDRFVHLSHPPPYLGGDRESEEVVHIRQLRLEEADGLITGADSY